MTNNTFAGLLHCDRHNVKHFIHINIFGPHSNLIRWLMLCPFTDETVKTQNG